jgi:iron complex outermembrane receptor protein
MIYRKKILTASIAACLTVSAAAHAEDASRAVQTPDGAAPGASAVPADTPDTAGGRRKTDKDMQELDTVIVTGIRESLKKSIDTKRIYDSHVEVITADDIGKMPDKNVADSLQRIPGVNTSSASANEGGFDENDRISMRGTNPSLTQTLINGHSVSSGDWFVLNQVGLVGRSVTYTLLPSELVGQVIVHKTAQASDIEGGVAGSVDIQTRKPLEFAKPLTLEASVGGVYSDLPSKTDPQFSALLNWKNDDKTFGVLAQVFYEERYLRRDGQEVLGYEQIAPGSVVAAAHPDLAGVYYPILLGSALFEQERKRKGGYVELEFAPTTAFSADLSMFSSKLDANNYNRNYLLWGTHFINLGGQQGGASGQAPDPGYVVRNNTLISAHFSPVSGTQYGVYDQISRPDESSQSQFINLDMTYHASDALLFKGKLGATKGDGKTPTQDVAEWNTGVGTGAFYNLNGTNTAAQWGLGSEPTNVPQSLSWIFGDQNVDVRDHEHWAQLDGAYTFGEGVLSDIKFGGRYAKHARSSEGVIGQGPGCAGHVPLNFAANFNCTDPNGSPFNPANIPGHLSFYPSDFGSELGGGFPTGIWYLSQSQLAAFNNAFTNRDPISRADWNSDYRLDEQNSAAFVQADFEGSGWSGNVGVRFVRTEENVVANVASSATTPGAITTSAFGPYLPTEFDNTYNDILPSANLKFDLREDLLLRFAASKTMTRPDYSALAGPISLSPPSAPGATGSGSGSNPNLKPVRSNNFDTSLEWYFAPRSIASASVFYLDLTNYIGYGHIQQSFKTFNSVYPQGFDAPYTLTVPVNSSGSVKGAELSFEMPLWENFGIAANYTYADGEENGGGPLVGTSKNTFNVSGYYENDHFNARVSYTHRSSFFSGLDRQTAFYQASTGNVSASLGYKFDDHWSLSLDGLNLNDPKLKYYALSQDQPRSIYDNGRQFYLTLHAKW